MCESCEKCESEKKKIRPRDVSIWGKVLVAAYVLAVSVLKWTGVFEGAEMRDVMTGALTLYLPFSTIDLNLALEKVFRGGGKDE